MYGSNIVYSLSFIQTYWYGYNQSNNEFHAVLVDIGRSRLSYFSSNNCISQYTCGVEKNEHAEQNYNDEKYTLQ